MNHFFIGYDGVSEPFSDTRFESLLQQVFDGYSHLSLEQYMQQVRSFLPESIAVADFFKLCMHEALKNITLEEPDWQYIAGRFFVLQLHHGSRHRRGVAHAYDDYNGLVDVYVQKGLYSSQFAQHYSADDIRVAGAAIVPERDMMFQHTQITNLAKRYLLKFDGKVVELPQHLYMSVALFLAFPEPQETRLDFALRLYHAISTQKISLPTPTLLNARTNFHQLSSCFKLNIDDGLREIYHGVENIAQISKYGGGVGVYLGNLRSKGASIRGVRNAGGGVNRWIKVINDTAVAVNQLGARAGAVSVTLDVWHADILDFFEIQTETGDVRQKSFDIFPAVSIPDMFMRRVRADEPWTLFDPHEIETLYGWRLQDFYGTEFEQRYAQLEADDRLLMKRTLKAKDVFKHHLKTVVETGMPYVLFRDTANRLNPNKHAGMIYNSQLCVEIQQNSSPSRFVEEVIEDGTVLIKYTPWDTVVCNLASINVAEVHNPEDIQPIIDLTARVLDNVITLNFYCLREAEITAKKYRSIGIGFLGLAEHLARQGLAYDSLPAREYVDTLFERYALATLRASNALARERGTYPLYEGSDWSKGIFFGRDASWYDTHSQLSSEWRSLREDIAQSGVRFGYHLAPAPNGSTSLLMGTTASVLPIYKKYFVQTNNVQTNINIAPRLSSDNFWYYKEYIHMELGDVIDMMSVIYKWIDQSISFEFLIQPEKVSPKDLFEYYFKAWDQQIKTVYYVRSMSLDVKECVSCSG